MVIPDYNQNNKENKTTVTNPQKRAFKQQRNVEKKLRKGKKKTGGIFDPRKKFDEENDATRAVVWCTKNVDIATEAHAVGQPLIKSPFHENNPELRKGKIAFRVTDSELIEMAKCKRNLLYFAQTYAQLKQRDGKYATCKLYPHQKKQLVNYIKYSKHIQAWSRQASKTTTAAIKLLWNVMFHNNRQCAILANKQKTSSEVLDKIKEIYYRLPFFMKAGVVAWNEKFIRFDNGCSILAAPCTKDAINGKTIHTLYIDEFAFCFDGNKEKQIEFLSNAVPVVSEVKGHRIIITSTPNGKDLFYELYDGAVKKENAYMASTVYWWQIPHRDVQWAKEMIATITLKTFKVQFEMSFDVTLNKLLSAFTMQELEKKSVNFVQHDFEGFVGQHNKYLRFSPEATKLRAKDYMVLIDLAEGLGGDYTTAHFLSLNHRIKNGYVEFWFNQEFVLEANDVPLDTEMPEFIIRTLKGLTTIDNCRFIIENNTYGDFFMNLMAETMERLNTFIQPIAFLRFGERNVSRNGSRRMGGRKVGLKTNSKIKRLSVNAFKLAMENNVFNITDTRTIEQINFFQKTKRGTYKAELGHDDNVTPYLHLSYAILTRNKGLIGFLDEYMMKHNLGGMPWRFAYNFDELRRRIEFDD